MESGRLSSHTPVWTCRVWYSAIYIIYTHHHTYSMYILTTVSKPCMWYYISLHALYMWHTLYILLCDILYLRTMNIHIYFYLLFYTFAIPCIYALHIAHALSLVVYDFVYTITICLLTLFTHIYYKIYLHNRYTVFYNLLFCIFQRHVFKFSGTKQSKENTNK